MTSSTPSDALRYPAGRFEAPAAGDHSALATAIDELEAMPAQLRATVESLSEEQLDTPYRPGGWTLRQVVHHLADSHLNAYVRTKLAVTEDHPTIRPYDQDAWGDLPDAKGPVAPSLDLIEAVHTRWVALFRALDPDDFLRPFDHPEAGSSDIATLVSTYAWDGRHHMGHIGLVAGATAPA